MPQPRPTATNETIMTELRSSEHHTKVHQEDAYQGVASMKGDARAAAGRTAYREEFQHDYGPDSDEALDGTESGREF
jgi:hypothetical protein